MYNLNHFHFKLLFFKCLTYYIQTFKLNHKFGFLILKLLKYEN